MEDLSHLLPLKIYKASAGSGKTYTLVREYLRLLLKSGDVYRFKRIIAMTFTNKAALEMKDRVIKTLNQLSKQEDKDLRLVQNYAAEFQMHQDELKEKASKALSAMLHNYSDLNIQTIDKFNVRLIRSFVRDLNMANDFEVLVDTAEFNEKVVDKFLDSIHSRDREEIKNRLVSDYLEAKLERGEAWDIRGELIETLKLFEKETFRVLLPQLLEYEFNFENLKQLKMHRNLIVEQFEKEKQAVLTPFLLNHDKEAFKSGFKVKNWQHVYGRLVKLKEQELLDFEGFSESNSAAIEVFLEENSTGYFYDECNKVLQFVARVEEQYKDDFLTYQYAVTSFFQLALLKYLVVQVQTQKLAENIIPINEINELISSQMRQENADYIYERVGVRFDHFLLDEFQDTSRMQWLNLIPLVHNSIAQNQSNLIVGDSKQAIYRFRNGVVEQFAKLPEIYNPENDIEQARLSDYFHDNSELNTLKDNWRSRKDIITFNNELFANLRKILDDEFQSYYADEDLIQNAINEAQGHVFVEVEPIESTFEDADEEEDTEEIGGDEAFLLERVAAVLSRGFQPKDICVLARSNKELGIWAKLLIASGQDVTTDEGLVVSNSVRVKFLVAWMQLILKPGSSQYQRDFVLNYMHLHPENNQDAFLKYFMRSHFDFQAFLDEHFQGQLVYRLRYENLYDLVLQILRQLDIDELSDPFLHFFCNLVQQFDINFGPNIERFLHYYNTRGKEKKVPLAEGNAIRLMTAHKSKGLEFPVVIMPKASWDWKVKSTKHLFFHEEKALFYLANISSNAKSTRLQECLSESEKEKNKLDTFNLFYVACTRAVDELHLRFGYLARKSDAKSGTSSALGFYMDGYLAENFASSAEVLLGKTQYSFGAPVHVDHQEFESKNLDIHLHGETLWFPEISLIDRDSLEAMSLNEERIFGRWVHQTLERMKSPEDLEEALAVVFRQNAMQESRQTTIRAHVASICADSTITDLIFPDFSRNEKALDECEIVLSPLERIRPDRVILGEDQVRVIEYKTGIERPRDIRQLEQYVFALREMGHADCAAYLVYTDQLRVKQIC